MLRFEPFYQPAPWGGRRFDNELGRKIPDGPVGEAWELVDLGDRQSRVAAGAHAGKTLGELWRAGALGGSAQGPFPFLVKWLDTEDKTSVQVHPSRAACDKLGHGLPKSEVWYVANADPGAVILAGHYPGLDPATLRQAAQGGTIPKWLYEVVPKVGDLIPIPAGTLHAIGAGFLLLEVQEPSDTTFRVYDWKRVGLDGRARELHLEQAYQAVDFAKSGPPKTQRGEAVGPSFRLRVLQVGAELAAPELRVIVAEAERTKLRTDGGEMILKYGDLVVLEPNDGRALLLGGSAALITEAPKSKPA
ncbi:MAG: class I mannose-6-phosphate isomerase [Deltaproteobacteria bacterium]|nr:class I mannose-6-phosphate isomerase [Deltaproteobacteria bacterium]